MKTIRILLVDDHPVVRSGFRRYLDAIEDLEVAGEANSGAAAYQAFVALQPDITILDIALPDVSGLDVLRRIRQRHSEARLLMVTMHENVLLMERAMQAGASGYLSKRHEPARLVQAIRRIAAGDSFPDPELTVRREHDASSLLERLTPREFEVFQLLAQGRSVMEISELLHLSKKTVGVHQTRIFKKLDLANSVQLALLAVRHQLIQP